MSTVVSNQLTTLKKRSFISKMYIKFGKKVKTYKIMSTISKTVDSFVSIASTSNSITLSLSWMGLITLPFSTGNACSLSLFSEKLPETFLDKCKKYKKHYQKAEQTIQSFDKFYRKSLQDNLIDKNEY